MANKTSDPQSPLVSIICRSVGRPQLGEALEAAAAQTHRPLEIVLVDAAALGEPAFRQVCAGKPVKLALPESALCRSNAANFGLRRASGEYLMFLDDDDWLAPNHVEHLLHHLMTRRDVDAVYSSTRKTDAAGKATLETFQQPFDRVLLMRDNYIPIHSVLFRRKLIDQGCEFDENFTIFEDWDFWLQASELTEFHHLDRCTAFYRSGGASQTAEREAHLQRFDSDHKLGQARAAIYDKWMGRWQGEQMNRLIGASQRDQAESVKHIGELSKALDGLRRARQKAERKALALDHRIEEIERLRDKLQFKIGELEKANTDLHGSLSLVQIQLQDVLGSRSWKITLPWRWLGGRLKSLTGGNPFPVHTASPAQETAAADSDAAPAAAPVPAGKAAPVEMTAPDGKPEAVKVVFDRHASGELDEFLASDERLSFGVAGARNKAAPPLLTVLLVFYNKAHLSLQCLRALRENADVPFELVIVDNASSDRTGALLKRLDNVKLIRNTENRGFVKAVNQGAELAAGEYLLLLNNDAFIEPGSLGAARDVLAEDAGVGAVGGRIQLLDGTLQEAGNVIWRDGSCAGYGRGDKPDNGAYLFRREVDYCSGAFLMLRTGLFRQLGGFDEAFAPAYYEESDFCLRLIAEGYRVVYEPMAYLRHYEFASTGSMRAAAALQKKNRTLFRKKHAGFLRDQPAADPARILHARTSNKHPNLLLIDDAVPHVSLGGGYPRCRHILHVLAQMPLNVTFYPLQFPNDYWDEVYQTLPANVEVLLERGRSGLAQLLRERAGFYRYVMVSRPTNMAFFNLVLQSLPAPARKFELIYDAEAVFAARELQWRELQGERIDAEERNRVLGEELALADQASAVLTVSKAEAELFRGRGQKRVLVLGHGLEPKPAPAPFDGRRGLLFVGALKDELSPNVDSLLWFVCNVLPRIENEIEGLHLNVVGHAVAPSLVSIERANIHLKGRLENLDQVYNENRVFVAPTRFAAGIPHKVHEAAAHGIPAVVTPLLARQLGWRHEREVLVGDGPDSFAEQCIRLYRDADLWRRLGDAARKAVARDCSQSKFRQTLLDLFPQPAASPAKNPAGN